MNPLRRVRSHLSGHRWTVGPALAARVRPRPVRDGRAWRTTVEDPMRGGLPVHGHFHPSPGARAAVVIVHGLGGSADSFYVHDATRVAQQQGLAVLRLHLRGAALAPRGDVYHGALTDDLHAALAALPHETLYLLGVSIGGHLALWAATEVCDPRLGGVVALCPPLDLARASRDIHRRSRRIYHDQVLGALKAQAVPMVEQGVLPLSRSALDRLRTIRQWDERVIVPRFGMASVDDYYADKSVYPVLHRIGIRTLLVLSRHDPMILGSTNADVLAAVEPSPQLDVRWVERGGHVGFPPRLDLGVAADRGLYPQLFGWLRDASRPTPP